MARLSDEACLIAGAGSGMGEAPARLFGREGARVMGADIDAAAAQRTAAGIRDAGGDAADLRVDVTDEAQTRAAADATLTHYGRIDVLFNNAGIPGVGSVEETDPDLFDRVMRVNVRGVFLICRPLVPPIP